MSSHVFLAACIHLYSHFSSTPCEAVHTQKQRFAFYCCEPNFWVALAVNNPSITSAGESTGSQSSGKGGKGASEETTYFEDEIEDNVLQGIIQRCYRLFRLFNGTFQSIADANNGDMDAVRKRLNLFMEFFVPSVRYQQLPFFTDLHGFQVGERACSTEHVV